MESSSKKKKRVAIYARVSTNTGEQDPNVQVSELTDLCYNRGWEVKEILIDQLSGTNNKRPNYQQLLALAKARKIDVIVISKLDRLSRNLKELIQALDLLSDLGVELFSLRDQFDMTTASGRLMANLISVFAAFELSLISERTKAGLAFARSKGKIIGRPQIKLDQEILELRNEKKMTYRQIEQQLGCSNTVIKRVLKSAVKSVSEDSKNETHEGK